MDAVAEQSIPALKNLVAPQRVAMLASRHGGALVSRPITTLYVDGANSVWFMIAADSAIAEEIAVSPSVCLSYLDANGGVYLSLRGSGTIVPDQQRIHELWNPTYSVWFEGPDDPNIVLLRVVVAEIEFWDAPITTVRRLGAVAKAITTGDSRALGAHARRTPP